MKMADKRFESMDFVDDYVQRLAGWFDLFSAINYVPHVINVTTRLYCLDYAMVLINGEVQRRGWRTRVEQLNGKKSIELGTIVLDLDNDSVSII